MAIADPDRPPTSADLAICTVVFGHSTFLGRSLVSSLLSSGRWTARVADTLPPPSPGPIHPDLASYCHVDVTDPSSLRSAVAGAVAVFLVDPLPSFPSRPPVGDFPRLHELSVIAAKSLISACRQSGVRRLVYTGSADVVFDGENDVCDADESLPYPDAYEDAINELRMQVEVLVLSANGMDDLLTCALRPSIIFGPEDPYFVHFIVKEARSGIAKFVIGNGKNICDCTYIDNVVHANLSVESALSSSPASVAGKPFFITNDEPVELWEFISYILENLGYKRPTFHIPAKLVLLVISLLKRVGDKLNGGVSSHVLSAATVHTLSSSRTFDCSKAKNQFGYSSIVSFQKGLDLTVKSLPRLEDLGNSQETRSEADRMLGSGVVADILLWRDEKKTFALVVTLFVLFYWLFLSGKTFVASSARILMVVCLSLFIHGILPSQMFGFNLKKIPSSCFEVSESTMRCIFLTLASLWNQGILAMRLLAQGDDWSIFFKFERKLVNRLQQRSYLQNLLITVLVLHFLQAEHDQCLHQKFLQHSFFILTRWVDKYGCNCSRHSFCSSHSSF
ncbi:3beta-hydroxysteroid-dehydrogenase/decarboxylase-like isoform X2 [Zingiber officinale]|uniref:3beta-hydroxysteroid- dehydrogenase/decarboxylase-like isoform X2 n=1 Tax=Zingiber officinale TaxID=94328 RepID=UPI001C4B6C0D|nr:3beta-hydroxysteroid-dehydrogenase/decarboxylase-like isoform X2 [Zingiber officinale]